MIFTTPNAILSLLLRLSVIADTSHLKMDRVGDYCGRLEPHEFAPRTGTSASLRSVQVLFRHGARGEHEKTDCFFGGTQTRYICHTRSSFGLSSATRSEVRNNVVSNTARTLKIYEGPANTCSQGQLLDEGIAQVERLAKYLRSSYPELYTLRNRKRMYFYSTDTQRTFATIHVLLSNLFTHRSLHAPFEVHTRDFVDDFFALNIPSCKRFVNLRRSFTSSQAYLDHRNTTEFQECKNLWESEFGTPFSVKADDCLLSAYCSNSTLPGGGNVDPALLSCVTNVLFELRAIKLGGVLNSSFAESGSQICQLGSYHVIDAIKRSVFRNNHIGALYSIHDETFVCLLNALGIWDGVWPKYASFIVLEFHADGTVRILRDGKELTHVSEDLSIPLFRNSGDVSAFCGA
jgi:hypothetical protein